MEMTALPSSGLFDKETLGRSRKRDLQRRKMGFDSQERLAKSHKIGDMEEGI
jgi:hypothetical protein